jgi:excisionase family DNA binding protein
MQKTDKLTYSISEFSELTGLSVPFLRGEIRKGHLRAKHVGSRVLILATEATIYLESRPDWSPGFFQKSAPV